MKIQNMLILSLLREFEKFLEHLDHISAFEHAMMLILSNYVPVTPE